MQQDRNPPGAFPNHSTHPQPNDHYNHAIDFTHSFRANSMPSLTAPQRSPIGDSGQLRQLYIGQFSLNRVGQPHINFDNNPNYHWEYNGSFEDTISLAFSERETHFHWHQESTLSPQSPAHITQDIEWTSTASKMVDPSSSEPADAIAIPRLQQGHSHSESESIRIVKAVIFYICDCGHETDKQRDMHGHVYGELRVFFCPNCARFFNQLEFEGHEREFPGGECGNSQSSESSAVRSDLPDHYIYSANPDELRCNWWESSSYV
ncbi:hypothetical protein M422DRAFT_250020 [Sphaerobolus stellatus SS14]|nr:hypothetical protein M422DRAFT_250020 [Sphaerobolus stellatus SS14]